MTGRTDQGRRRLALAGQGRPLRAVPHNAMASDITALRAETQIAALHVDSWPRYGSPEWLQLDPRDRRTYAATLEAAELWRRVEDERARLDDLMDNDPEAWWREITTEARREASRIVRARGAAQIAEDIRAKRARAENRPACEVRATQGWPPVAIPGRPGWYRHLIDGKQADLPTKVQGNE
ncbi:DUF2742 domain-containing protein [Streptomyces chartreusis]